jgi:hypothetical protein
MATRCAGSRLGQAPRRRAGADRAGPEPLVRRGRRRWPRRPTCSITYETGDVFALDPARRFDVVVSALFTHHLDDAQLVRFLRWMQATARLGWFVNDLHRHRCRNGSCAPSSPRRA